MTVLLCCAFLRGGDCHRDLEGGREERGGATRAAAAPTVIAAAALGVSDRRMAAIICIMQIMRGGYHQQSWRAW
jgi:hypothetical protein